MLYFLGYANEFEDAPKLFSDRVKSQSSPDYEKGMTHVLVWQADDDWSVCGEAIHVEGAETPIIDRNSKIECQIHRDDPNVPAFHSKFSLKRPVIWEALDEDEDLGPVDLEAEGVKVIKADASIDYFHNKPGDRMYFLFAFETLTYKLDHINREDYQGRFWI